MAEAEWWYVDPEYTGFCGSRRVRGPYPREELRRLADCNYQESGSSVWAPGLPQLLVARKCDDMFLSVARLTLLFGRHPFAEGPEPPPVTSAVLGGFLAEEGEETQEVLQKLIEQKQEELEGIKEKSEAVEMMKADLEKIKVSRNTKSQDVWAITEKIHFLTQRISQLEQEKLVIEKEDREDERKATVLTNSIDQLEEEINEQEIKTEIEELERRLAAVLKVEIGKLKQKVAKLDGSLKVPTEAVSANDEAARFLLASITRKQEDLRCSVCLEIASAPIFQCLKSHVLCMTCRPRLAACPECRVPLALAGAGPVRHRFAERTAQEVEEMRREVRRLEGVVQNIPVVKKTGPSW
jgi:hypothetical protein